MLAAERPRLPTWIRAPLPSHEYAEVQQLLKTNGLVTVCREARCPNLAQCWSSGTATLMLLGDRCTRRCAFCSVATEWRGGEIDATEPERVARTVRSWGLKYVVLTMVARDDLQDQGANHLAKTIDALHRESPGTLVEMLASDLGGSEVALREVLKARPDVFAHNVETVRRLTSIARDRRASYERSLSLLEMAKKMDPSPPFTKSSLMLGLGEEKWEIVKTLEDLREAFVDIVTIGQYLRPGGEGFTPVARYVTPTEFAELGARARSIGFKGVASGPMVRSSYMAKDIFRAARGK